MKRKKYGKKKKDERVISVPVNTKSPTVIPNQKIFFVNTLGG